MTTDNCHQGDIKPLAQDIAERRTGMPAYLVDDETWAAALAEAEATYVPPPAKSPLAEAIERAERVDPLAFIGAYNEMRRRQRDA